MNVAAFFDIDGTLARQSLMIYHFKQLLKMGLIDETIWHRNIKPYYEAYERRQDDYDNYLLQLAEAHKKAMRNIDVDFNRHISKLVVEKYGEIVYRFTRERLKYHQENKHKIFFISGSPDFLVEEMAKKYNITDFRATHYIIENNQFNSEVVPMWDSISKKTAMDDLVNQYNVDLKNSYAYGDTAGDLSMFQIVGKAIAINPTKELILKIRKSQEMIDKTLLAIERKDVVYHLDARVNFE